MKIYQNGQPKLILSVLTARFVYLIGLQIIDCDGRKQGLHFQETTNFDIFVRLMSSGVARANN
jgi:hypothetical protein